MENHPVVDDCPMMFCRQEMLKAKMIKNVQFCPTKFPEGQDYGVCVIVLIKMSNFARCFPYFFPVQRPAGKVWAMDPAIGCEFAGAAERMVQRLCAIFPGSCAVTWHQINRNVTLW